MFLLSCSVLFTVCQLVAAQNLLRGTLPDIVYKRQNALYQWIYDDTGTGCEHALTLHHPFNFQHGFYPLGDLAINGYYQPTEYSVLVMDLGGGALAPPKDFTWKWTDAGTGGEFAVTIYQMEPEDGYVCLGHVAVGRYDDPPDRNKYRCVKEEYVMQGKYEQIWKDTGSGGDYDCVIYGNRVSLSDPYGIDAGTFTAFDNYDTPAGAPYLLNGQKVKNVLDVNLGSIDAPLTLYEMPDVDAIYDDSGTGAYRALGIWRGHGPQDSFSLGDYCDHELHKGSYHKPGVLLVAKSKWIDGLSPPVEYSEVWRDSGSGGDQDVVFYKPRCREGFIPLGHIAIASYSELPDTSIMRCVNATYTLPGYWEFIWNDEGSGCYDAVSVYRSMPSEDGLGVGGMGTIGAYTDMSDPAFVLNPSFVNYVSGSPAKQYIMTNLQYHLNDAEVFDKNPERIKRVVVDNHGNTPQSTTVEVKYEYSEDYTWNNHVAGEFGVQMAITAGIPFLFEEKLEISASAEYAHDWGGSTSTTISDAVLPKVDVEPCSTKEVYVMGLRYTTDVPYTATLTTVYEDDSTGTRDNVSGVFRGVEVTEVHVTYGPDIPIEGGCP